MTELPPEETLDTLPMTDAAAIDNFAELPEEERDPHWYKRVHSFPTRRSSDLRKSVV